MHQTKDMYDIGWLVNISYASNKRYVWYRLVNISYASNKRYVDIGW